MKSRAERAIYVVDRHTIVTLVHLSKTEFDVNRWMINPKWQESDAMKKVIRILEADRV